MLFDQLYAFLDAFGDWLYLLLDWLHRTDPTAAYVMELGFDLEERRCDL